MKKVIKGKTYNTDTSLELRKKKSETRLYYILTKIHNLGYIKYIGRKIVKCYDMIVKTNDWFWFESKLFDYNKDLTIQNIHLYSYLLHLSNTDKKIKLECLLDTLYISKEYYVKLTDELKYYNLYNTDTKTIFEYRTD